MITLKELALKCNVSIATVSNILNGKSNVSEETKKRVLKVIEETGYKPNYMARGLRANKTKTIGIIVDDLCAFSTPNLVEGIMSKCEEKSYRVVIENLRFYQKFSTDDSSNPDFIASVNSAINQMMAIKVDGIIYVASYSRLIDYLPSNLEIPIVVSYAYSNNVCSVQIDDEKSAFEMTEHLISKGSKSIIAVLGSKNNIHTNKRIEGYKSALKKNKIAFNEDLLIYGNWSRTDAFNACKNLPANFFDKEDCGIFCFNDEMAAGVYDYLRTINKIPGKDIKIVGFDNRDFCDFMNPPLTTMEIPLAQIGEESAELVLKKINGTEHTNNIEVQCRLIQRKSD